MMGVLSAELKNVRSTMMLYAPTSEGNSSTSMLSRRPKIVVFTI